MLAVVGLDRKGLLHETVRLIAVAIGTGVRVFFGTFQH